MPTNIGSLGHMNTLTMLDVAADRKYPNKMHRFKDYGIPINNLKTVCEAGKISQMTEFQGEAVLFTRSLGHKLAEAGYWNFNVFDPRLSLCLREHIYLARSVYPMLPFLENELSPMLRDRCSGTRRATLATLQDTCSGSVVMEAPRGIATVLTCPAHMIDSEACQNAIQPDLSVSLCPSHNLWGTAIYRHLKKMRNVVRIDMNAVTDGRYDLSDFLGDALMPVLSVQIYAELEAQYCSHDTFSQADQMRSVVHCKESKNRTAAFTLALYVAFYHKYPYTVEELAKYLQRLRPILDFRSESGYQDPCALCAVNFDHC